MRGGISQLFIYHRVVEDDACKVTRYVEALESFIHCVLKMTFMKFSLEQSLTDTTKSPLLKTVEWMI